MQTVLFHETIFGPIHSRRLGTSLGINLMPNDGKVCSFDCLYCEAGFNAQGAGRAGLPSRENVRELLEQRLRTMRDNSERLDVITFSGNGEPTLHPEFAGIIDDTIALRDKYFPEVKISVLTNATRIELDNVADALKKVDNNILKLDSAIDSTVKLLDRPTGHYTVAETVENLRQFNSTGIIQTMLLRGVHKGNVVDNTTDAEIEALIEAYKTIQPREIMIYSIDRPTPERQLQKVPREELDAIAAHIVAETGIPVQVA